MPASTCLRAQHHALDALIEGDGRRARRSGQALLQAGGGSIDLPGVDGEIHAAQRGGGVDVQQAVVAAADRRRCRPAAAPWWWRCRRAPGPAASGRCCLTAASIASGANTVPHSVSMVATSAPQRAAISCSRWPKRPKIGTSTLSPGSMSDTSSASMPARAVPSTRNDQRLLRLEQGAQQRHGLVHVGRELGVELTLQRHRHGAQHARVDVDRSRPHQQPRAGVQLIEGLAAWRYAGHAGARRCSRTIEWTGEAVKLPARRHGTAHSAPMQTCIAT